MRQWVTPRSLMLHVLFIVIASGCLVAGWWQVHRAMQGNTLSYLYSVEWPAFAVVAGIGWWQMFHDTPEDIANRKAYHTRMRAASVAVVARTLPRSARAITVGSKESGGKMLPGGSSSARAVGPGGRQQEGPAAGGLAIPSGDLMTAGEGDLDAVLLAAEENYIDPNDEMAVYNRYLATLALHGKAKTWRNPKGV